MKKVNGILIYGPPGSGKGTHGKRLGELNGFKHFSAGDMFRNIDPSTDLGLKVKNIMNSGALIPDDVVISLAKEFILKTADSDDTVILDGLPRTALQAKLIKDFVNVKGIININVSEDILISRLLERAVKEGRSDDNPETIKNRMLTFKNETIPVLKEFSSNLLIPINIYEERDVNDVFLEVKEKLSKHLEK